MKTTQLVPAVILGAATIFSSCNTPEKQVEQASANVEEATENVQAAQEELKEAKTEEQMANEEWMTYKEEQEAKIRENEDMIAVYREMEKDSKYKAKYRKKIDELEQKNKEMKIRIGEYKRSTKEKWDAFKREFSHDMEELGSSLKDIGKDNVK